MATDFLTQNIPEDHTRQRWLCCNTKHSHSRPKTYNTKNACGDIPSPAMSMPRPPTPPERSPPPPISLDPPLRSKNHGPKPLTWVGYRHAGEVGFFQIAVSYRLPGCEVAWFEPTTVQSCTIQHPTHSTHVACKGDFRDPLASAPTHPGQRLRCGPGRKNTRGRRRRRVGDYMVSTPLQITPTPTPDTRRCLPFAHCTGATVTSCESASGTRGE